MSCTNNKDPFCYECSKHSKLDKPTGQVIKRFCLGDCKWDHNHKTCISHTSAETGGNIYYKIDGRGLTAATINLHQIVSMIITDIITY